MTNELKAIIESPYELVVENHIVLFGGRDLTGAAYYKNPNGTSGEYFSKNVDLESDYTQTGKLYVDFEHGHDPDNIGNDKNTVLGYVDWKTTKIDDEGVIVRRVLNRRHRYMKWLEPLIKAGVVGTSSLCVEKESEKTADGEIVRWPLKRDTLTLTPMEPRMINENVLSAMKSMVEDIPEMKSLIPSDAALPDNEDNNQTMETNIMDENEIKALAKQEAADMFKAYQEQQAAEAEAKAAREAEIEAAKVEAYKQGVEDVKSHKVSYHTTAPVDDDNDGVGAFKSWMQTGQKNHGLIEPGAEYQSTKDAKAAWNVTTGASGGYLVPDPLYNQIVAKRDLSSWVRQMPVQMFQTSADHLLVPREDTSLTDFVLTAEAGAYDEEEGTVSQKDLILYKYTKLTKVSEEFLMYNSTNWESWFANALGRAVAGTENAIFTSGTGTSQPEGVVTGATVANTTATTDIILPSEFAAFLGYLTDGYNVPSECGLLMNNTTKWYLAGYTSDAFTYQMTPAGTGGANIESIMGYRVVVDDDIVVYTTASAKCVLFGNMGFYGMVEKPGIVVQRNPYLYMANGQIGIFASIFRGGGVLQGEAFYYLTNHS